MTIELHISRMFRGPLIILMKSCVTCHAIKEKLTFYYEHIDSSRFFGGWGGGESANLFMSLKPHILLRNTDRPIHVGPQCAHTIHQRFLTVYSNFPTLATTKLLFPPFPSPTYLKMAIWWHHWHTIFKRSHFPPEFPIFPPWGKFPPG